MECWNNDYINIPCFQFYAFSFFASPLRFLLLSKFNEILELIYE